MVWVIPLSKNREAWGNTSFTFSPELRIRGRYLIHLFHYWSMEKNDEKDPDSSVLFLHESEGV